MTQTGAPPEGGSIRLADLLLVGISGLRARKGRTLLTALGVAIGIASMVAVVGISASSKAGLRAELEELGTNLLQVKPGDSVLGERSHLPVEAEPMINAVPTVVQSAGVSRIDAAVARNQIDDSPYGLSVVAIDGSLGETLGLEIADGRMIDSATQSLPVAVLGAVAADRLAIRDLVGGPTVTVGESKFQVVGILKAHPLHPDLDRSALIGYRFVVDEMGTDPYHSAIYVRISPGAVDATRSVLARVANPGAPNEVAVSRPSDALEAQTKVDQRLQSLLISLGGVALLVGGIGIANVLVISVLERRSEIGLRRALGATRGQIRTQFIVEAAALATLGGGMGVGLGMMGTTIYAKSQGWLVSLPTVYLLFGVVIALAIGAIAGLYPASKAARLDPADAVRPHG